MAVDANCPGAVVDVNCLKAVVVNVSCIVAVNEGWPLTLGDEGCGSGSSEGRLLGGNAE